MDKCYPWILAASTDDCAHWSDPCTRLIAASDAAAATNNRHHPWITSSICILLGLRNYKSSVGSGRDNDKSQLGVVGGKIIKSAAAVAK